MERPRLFEYPIYAAILAVAGVWVYGLPPFTHEPEARMAGVHGVQTAEESTTALGGPGSQAEPRSLARRDGDAGEADLDQADLNQQPELDPQPNLLRVTANTLNMRAKPDARSPRVGSYPRGAVVEPVTTQGNWVLVRTVEDAATGWMYADYLGEVAEN